MRARVEPVEHLRFEWTAFWRLSSERQIGFGIGPIPWAAIEAYCDRSGIADIDRRDRFHRLIRAMDAIYLERGKPESEKK